MSFLNLLRTYSELALNLFRACSERTSSLQQHFVRIKGHCWRYSACFYLYWVDLVIPRTAYQNHFSLFALIQQFDSPLNLRVNEEQIPLTNWWENHGTTKKSTQEETASGGWFANSQQFLHTSSPARHTGKTVNEENSPNPFIQFAKESQRNNHHRGNKLGFLGRS